LSPAFWNKWLSRNGKFNFTRLIILINTDCALFHSISEITSWRYRVTVRFVYSARQGCTSELKLSSCSDRNKTEFRSQICNLSASTILIKKMPALAAPLCMSHTVSYIGVFWLQDFFTTVLVFYTISLNSLATTGNTADWTI